MLYHGYGSYLFSLTLRNPQEQSGTRCTSTWAGRSAFFTLTCSGVSMITKASLGGPGWNASGQYVTEGATLCWNPNPPHFCWFFLFPGVWKLVFLFFCFLLRKEPQWNFPPHWECMVRTWAHEDLLPGRFSCLKVESWLPESPPFPLFPSFLLFTVFAGSYSPHNPALFPFFCFEVNKNTPQQLFQHNTHWSSRCNPQDPTCFWL